MTAAIPGEPMRVKTSGCLVAAVAALLSCAAPVESAAASTTTPIRKVVVIFQENVSFDHYFATYPVAENRAGEPAFQASKGTPSVNGLSRALRERNPNTFPPFRLSRSHAATCDQDHDYTAEQQAYHGGIVDRFIEFTGNAEAPCEAKTVMAYFDGNTVTAIWNYAQAFAMSDDFFGATFGPSTPGALNLVSGQTHGVEVTRSTSAEEVAPGSATVIGDPDPYYDDCRSDPAVGMSGRNVGDLLNAKGVKWGWFQGGFRPTATGLSGNAICGAYHKGSDG